MIFSVCWGRIQGVTWNLEHLVDVTCRVSCGKSEFKLYKIQTKSENHETCGGVVLSHVEAMVKNWEDFEQVVTSDAKNPDISTCDHFVSHVITSFLASDVTTCSKSSQFFTTASTCDNTMPPQVSWFSDFVWIIYNLNSLFPQLTRHVTSKRCSRFHVTPWIRPQHTRNIMNINFWMTKFHYSMDLQFKFEIRRKNQRNEIN